MSDGLGKYGGRLLVDARQTNGQDGGAARTLFRRVSIFSRRVSRLSTYLQRTARGGRARTTERGGNLTVGMTGTITHPLGGPRFCVGAEPTVERGGMRGGEEGERDGPWLPRRRCTRGGRRRSWNTYCSTFAGHRLGGREGMSGRWRGARDVRAGEGLENYSQRTGRSDADGGARCSP